jgi:hypothetical protein
MNWIDEARKKRELWGLIKYGPISPQNDARCFKREMIEELLDSLNYCQWSFDKGEISKDCYEVIEKTVKLILTLLTPCERAVRLTKAIQVRTFEEYCQERWGFSRIQAHRLIKASNVSENLLPMGNKTTSERQVRPLTHLEPEQQKQVWNQAVKTAPNGKGYDPRRED